MIPLREIVTLLGKKKIIRTVLLILQFLLLTRKLGDPSSLNGKHFKSLSYPVKTPTRFHRITRTTRQYTRAIMSLLCLAQMTYIHLDRITKLKQQSTEVGYRSSISTKSGTINLIDQGPRILFFTQKSLFCCRLFYRLNL